MDDRKRDPWMGRERVIERDLDPTANIQLARSSLKPFILRSLLRVLVLLRVPLIDI